MLQSKVKDLVNKTLKIADEYEFDYDYFGIRFEDKGRDLGDIITDVSRFNNDRDDERDFPDFESDEYDDLPSAEGVSAWSLEEMKSTARRYGEETIKSFWYTTKHCYLLGSNELDYIDGMDDGETILVNAKVLYKFY